MPAVLDGNDPQLVRTAAEIRLLVLDVDGVLTDGRLYYDDHGAETKAFHVRDGYGIKRVLGAGIAVVVISGRRSAAVERRLAELGVEHALLGREDKDQALAEIRAALKLADASAMACIGDDVPDLPLISSAALGIAVADAHPAVLAAATWQTRAPGGHGAVREVCDLLVAARTGGSH